MDVEFISLLLTLLAGFFTSFGLLWDIRKKTSENSERITRIEARQERLEITVEREFEKCDMHCKGRGWKPVKISGGVE